MVYTYNAILLSQKKKKNEVLIPATTWMNIENVTLRERSQTQEVMYCLIPLIRNIQKGYLYEIARNI